MVKVFQYGERLNLSFWISFLIHISMGILFIIMAPLFEKKLEPNSLEIELILADNVAVIPIPVLEERDLILPEEVQQSDSTDSQSSSHVSAPQSAASNVVPQERTTSLNQSVVKQSQSQQNQTQSSAANQQSSDDLAASSSTSSSEMLPEDFMDDMDWQRTSSTNNSTETANLSDFLSSNDDTTDNQQLSEWQERTASSTSTVNTQSGPIESSDSNNVISGQQDEEIQQQLARLQERMDQNFNSSNTSAASEQQSDSPGYVDGRISGEVAVFGRKLISQDRLDLSQYVSTRDPSWPSQITVSFQVDESGFVRLTNFNDINAYGNLSLGIYQLFQGPVFLSLPGAGTLSGQITFQIQ